jgi:hypothetical protein
MKPLMKMSKCSKFQIFPFPKNKTLDHHIYLVWSDISIRFHNRATHSRSAIFDLSDISGP